MKNSPVSQGNRKADNGFGRVGLERVEAPFKTKTTPQTAAGKAQPPNQPVAERYPALEKQEVILTFFAPDAAEVTVAGNFNGWRPDATPLKNTGEGKWAARLLLRSGQYEYRFIVDGEWCEDPQAAQRVANAFGGFNSVLVVPLEIRTSIL